MALRKFNPITPGMRHKVLSKFEEITSDTPHKPLLEPIKKSVESAYGVTVTSVRTLRVDGKTRQRYTKTGVVRGRTNGYKKAIVSLAEGQTIDFYDNI
jgi:ribosomal protein L23